MVATAVKISSGCWQLHIAQEKKDRVNQGGCCCYVIHNRRNAAASGIIAMMVGDMLMLTE
jgi:hypothetical protein